MRIRKKPWAQPELAKCNFFVKEPCEHKGKWKLYFKSQQPLHLELGCGKGGFVALAALQNPDINFLAVDIKSDMLAVGRRNIVKVFEKHNKSIDNIALIAKNIEQIDTVLSPDDKIERIYINFCNPWPRGKHKKRRLTYTKKLNMYRDFLIDAGEIRFKTDDDELFFESLEYFEQAGFKIIYKTLDLHNSDFENNIQTEHEKMFSDEGIRIKYCTAVKQ